MLAVSIKVFLIALFLHRCSANKVNERFYPRYHLAPPYGWMNDPNGFSVYKGEYHLFYQYNPESSQEPGTAHWGHAKSQDLMNWERLPIAMYPDEPYDINGVFSGSAIIVNDEMKLIYTGNRNNPAEQKQALATSTDGVKFTKYEGNPIIEGEKYQPHIRDPKVWKHGDSYYMVLGNSFNNNTLGRVLLYSSKDLISWKMESILGESNGTLGYMWECPDFFELNGYYMLLMSPQGVKPQGDNFRNLYQTGYIVGNFDYNTHKFTPLTEFVELDRGHDVYATQTLLYRQRRIVVAWMDMWERNYPERDDGFTGLMTIPRVLTLTKDLKVIQTPIQELNAARGHTLYAGRPRGGHTVELDDKAGEIKITASRCRNLDLYIESRNASVSITYDHEDKTVTLDRGGEDGVRRTTWEPRGRLVWYILVDASSIELFCGEGEVTFTSRYFPYSDVRVRLGDHARVDNMVVSSMRRTVDVPDES